MERSPLRLLLHACALSAARSFHVYLPEPLNWTDARLACQESYSDLSPVTSAADAARLRLASAEDPQRAWLGNHHRAWVGLHQEPPPEGTGDWRWSGGGDLGGYQPWGLGEPNNWLGQETGVEVFPDGRWNDVRERMERPCYCISLRVVEDGVRWEEALERCRQGGGGRGDLLSMTTDTRLLLALTELRKSNATDTAADGSRSLWLGLRFLGGRWLWVNGDPMSFQGWGPAGQDPTRCPVQHGSCGAMTRQGVWEARDCRDKLSFICD